MDYNSVNLEILRMARQLVLNDYTDRRAEMHNKWLVESEHLWRSQRLRLAYPTIPTPPTEKDILEIANNLMKFVSKQSEQPVEKVTPVIEEVLPITEEPPVVIEEPPVVIEEPPFKEIPLPAPRPIPSTEEVSVQPAPYASRVLPRVLQKLEEMKRGLF